MGEVDFGEDFLEGFGAGEAVGWVGDGSAYYDAVGSEFDGVVGCSDAGLVVGGCPCWADAGCEVHEGFGEVVVLEVLGGADDAVDAVVSGHHGEAVDDFVGGCSVDAFAVVVGE